MWIKLNIFAFKALARSTKKTLARKTKKTSRMSKENLHQLLQAGEVDAVYAVHTRRADVLLDVSSVHKRQVYLLCHIGCCEDHNVGMSET